MLPSLPLTWFVSFCAGGAAKTPIRIYIYVCETVKGVNRWQPKGKHGVSVGYKLSNHFMHVSHGNFGEVFIVHCVSGLPPAYSTSTPGREGGGVRNKGVCHGGWFARHGIYFLVVSAYYFEGISRSSIRVAVVGLRSTRNRGHNPISSGA